MRLRTVGVKPLIEVWLAEGLTWQGNQVARFAPEAEKSYEESNDCWQSTQNMEHVFTGVVGAVRNDMRRSEWSN